MGLVSTAFNRLKSAVPGYDARMVAKLYTYRYLNRVPSEPAA